MGKFNRHSKLKQIKPFTKHSVWSQKPQQEQLTCPLNRYLLLLENVPRSKINNLWLLEEKG